LLKAALLLPSTVWTSLGLGCNLKNHPSLRPARLLMAMSHRQCKDLCQASVQGYNSATCLTQNVSWLHCLPPQVSQPPCLHR
jgi:hypothetical protein